MKRYIPIILFLGIVLLSFFLRFYQLGSIPSGMDSDETSIGYNAYSILKTGKDEYGEFLPLYFRSFGDQKLPVYIYLTSGSIALFGLTTFAVRFPSAVLGSITVILLFLLIYDLSRKKYLALLTSLFLAINPWHLFFSRAALEDNVALFFSVLGTWLFIRMLHSTRRSVYLSLSIVSFLFSFYSYNVTRLLAPLLFVMLVFLYREQLLKFRKRIFILPFFIGLVFSIPFATTFFTAGGISSAKGALITSSDVTATYISWRSYLIGLPSLFTKTIFNRITFLIWQYFQNVVGFLSPSFFFISGAPAGNPGIGNSGEFYLYEFPTILAGIILYFRNRIKFLSLFFFWFVITLLVASLSKTVPHVTRGYFLVLPLTVFSAYGFYSFMKWVFENRKKVLPILSAFVAVLSIGYALAFYFTSYYVRFPIADAMHWSSEDKAMVVYIKQNQGNYKHIIFDKGTPFRYSAFLFYDAYPPTNFQRTAKRYPTDNEGFSWVQSFGKYEFRDIDWKKDLEIPNTLIVSSTQDVPDTLKNSIEPVASFDYPVYPKVLSAGETIYEFPVTDNAYVLLATKK